MRQWVIGMRQLVSTLLVIAAPFIVGGFLLAGSRGLAIGLLIAFLL
jgi:hypothetical protein